MSKCRYDLSEDCNNTDCLNCVLDKIRTEIDEESVKSFKYSNWERAKALEWVLEIIDKYKEVTE